MKNELLEILNELKNKNIDDNIIQAEIDKLSGSIKTNKIDFIQRTTPKSYWSASIGHIDQKIIESKKMVVWITGTWGVGKTYSLYAIRNHKIMKHNNYYFEIKNENELNYDTNITRINAIDNLTVNENKMKYLCQLYFDIIDFHWKNKKKLYISSTVDFDTWIKELNRYSSENAGAIASRFSNNLEVIKLLGNDRRKK